MLLSHCGGYSKTFACCADVADWPERDCNGNGYGYGCRNALTSGHSGKKLAICYVCINKGTFLLIGYLNI